MNIKKLMAVVLSIVMVIGCTSSSLAITTDPEISEREQTSADAAIEAAGEGMVLLKNDDNALPLEAGAPIALYGTGSIFTVASGTGSGDVNERSTASVYEALAEVFDIANTDSYIAPYQDSKAAFDAGELTESNEYVTLARAMFATTLKGNEIDLEENASAMVDQGVDTAIYTISRICGEGSDRSNVAQHDGDYYLSEMEEANIKTLASKFDKVIVLLNVSNVQDLNFLNDIEGVDAALLMGQPGSSGAYAVAKILTGEVTPSGKLADTWPVNFMDIPSSATLGTYYDAKNTGYVYPEYYYEDIYVGYRYFDTFGVAPLYPFGYGLSYTTFDIAPDSVTADAEHVAVTVTVTNTGDTYSGKEVVEVYYSAPDGTLEKPYQELIAYAKTDLLAPGEAQTLTITFNTPEMASYSEEQAAYILEAGDYFIRVGDSSRNTKVAAKITLDDTAITEQLSNHKTLSTNTAAEKADYEENKLTKADATPYTYDGEDEQKAAAPVIELAAADFVTVNNASTRTPADVTTYYSSNDPQTDSAVYAANGGWNSKFSNETLVPVETNPDWTLLDVYQGNCTLEQLVAGMSSETLEFLVNGIDPDQEYGVSYARANTAGSMTLNDVAEGLDGGSSVGYLAHWCQGTVWSTTGRYYNHYLIPNQDLSDGPAGLRISATGTTDLYTVTQSAVVSEDGSTLEQPAVVEIAEDQTYYQYCTSFPVGVLLAQTWNPQLLVKVGECYSVELNEMGVSALLGPGMNIHRTPLCGRNFEYYSEDPRLCGLTAMNLTLGMQASEGVGVTLKHFAANNNENDRTHSNSIVSERALREIYLKGFEIAVKGAQPMYIMTSYNLINGVYTVNDYELQNNILRDEWGFKGTIMTDYGAANQAQANNEYHLNKWQNTIASGCDWLMGGYADSIYPSVQETGWGRSTVDASLSGGVDTNKFALGYLQASAINGIRSTMYSCEFGPWMADYVDPAIVTPAEIKGLQEVDVLPYTERMADELVDYVMIDKAE